MFTVYGPGVTDPIRLEKLFERHAIAQVAAISPKQAVKSRSAHSHSAYPSAKVNKYYQCIDHTDERTQTLLASQMMTSPVTSVQTQTTAVKVLDILDISGFRHIPVMSLDNQLVGIVSDRDVIRCMCGSNTVCLHCSKDKQNILIDELMKDQVLTASVDTDARHIARLFVEKRIGAVPVMAENRLVGIITRSDILRAVMQHFNLNLWS